MNLYYFDVNDCGAVTSDDDGHDCADWYAVEDSAIVIARGVVTADFAMGGRDFDGTGEIRNAERELVHVMPVFLRNRRGGGGGGIWKAVPRSWSRIRVPAA